MNDNQNSNFRAQPVKMGDNKWYCNKCHVQCMTDSRMGSLDVILMCKCNEWEDLYWVNDRR